MNVVHHLSYPYGLYIDDKETVYIADEQSRRIIAWDYGSTNGRVVAGGNGAGNGLNQLNSPTDVIVDKESGSIIICDHGNQRVVRWARDVTIPIPPIPIPQYGIGIVTSLY